MTAAALLVTILLGIVVIALVMGVIAYYSKSDDNNLNYSDKMYKGVKTYTQGGIIYK